MKVAVVVIVAALAAATMAQSDSGKVAATREQLERARAEAERLAQSQSDIFKQLERIEQELDLSSRLLRQLRNESRSIIQAVDATNDTIRILQSLSSSEGQLAAQRLRRLYIVQPVNQLDVPYLYSGQVESAIERSLANRLVRADSRDLISLTTSISDATTLLANLKSREEQLERNTIARAAEEKRVLATLSQREKILAGVKDESRRLTIQLDALEQSAVEVSDIFAELEQQARGASEYLWQHERDLTLKMKGKLFWPLTGAVVTPFGLRRDARTGITSKSNGVVLATRAGAKVIAALTGEVIYIGWARGLERFVVVDHGGSIYTLYGNLGELLVSEGDQVIRGENFAVTSGNRLHFEIRDGKTPVDPLPWLRR